MRTSPNHSLFSGLLFVISFLFCGPFTTMAQPKPIVAMTGAPRLLDSGSAGVLAPMTEAEYQEYAPRLAKSMPAFVVMKKKPEKLSPQARFGINFSFGGRNRTWIWDGDEKQGYVFYGDINANGDLSDDAPFKFETKDGTSSLLLQLTTKAEGSDVTYPVVMKMVVAEIELPGKTKPELCLKNYEDTVREGAIQVGNRSLLFSLTGSSGIYNERYNRLMFDLDGNGKLDPKTEQYRVWEQFVNVGDTSYEFTVDRYGQKLTLTPLAEKLPPRAILMAGHPAPEFNFTDLNGQPRKLADYRGKLLLLNFWGTWCGPCVAAAPKLVETYDKFHARGFEILGVTIHDPAEDVRKFTAEKKMTWTQTREDDDKGPLHRQYRIMSWPTYLLIDKDGTILKSAADTRNMDLAAELEKLLPASEKK